jgi:hypothetical protein
VQAVQLQDSLLLTVRLILSASIPHFTFYFYELFELAADRVPPLSTKMTLWPLPKQWAERLSCDASTLLAIIVAFEILFMTVPFPHSRSTNYAAHLGGYAMGALGGFLWKRDHGGTAHGPWGSHGSKESRWYEKLLGR